ncbi:MAG: hypothetical protein IPK32_24040 [Verrucomicrobiaceae bacterium]|nr:hypothetical protein [Verrucomicrobiaceae bacterium]
MNSSANVSEPQQHPIAQGMHFFAMLGAVAGLCQHGFQAGVLVAYALPAAVVGLVLCGIIHLASADQELSAARIANYQVVIMGKAMMLFAFYWLFRWTLPGLLPESLQTQTWAQILPVCLSGGALFALPSALTARLAAHAGATPAQNPSEA